ncbi:discoidin domain-containing protein [Streptacidiphilus sp. N1-10]|uniref:Discoidin domain-containing protein n=1 Tax=Streptacidiphilus jeojiensis TaxID=3229225 RepID=A0ABV6XKM5_9ACTN
MGQESRDHMRMTRRSLLATAVAVAGTTLVSPARALALSATSSAPQPLGEAEQWASLRTKLAGITGQWTDQNYTGAVSNTMPDTALLGNGDVGVTSGGSTGVKTFTISKGDFWNANPSPVPAPIGGVTLRATARPPGSNLALGATATASSVNGSLTPDRAVNGQWTSGYEGWVSDLGKPQWIALDLGTAQTVARYILRNDDAARPGNDDHTTKDLTLQTSTDGTSWTDVDTVTGNTAATLNRSFAPVTTRHLRFYITEPTQADTDDSIANPRARIGQIELFGPQSDPDLALGATATASSVDQALTPDRAVNGQWTSGYEGWVSDLGKPQWIALDLGSAQTVARYVLRSDDAARPGNDDHTTKSYTLQSSPDGSTWTDIDTVSGNTAAVIDRDLSPGPVTTRHLRFYITEPTQADTDDSIANPRARIGQIQLFPLTKSQQDPDAPSTDPFHEVQRILDARITTSVVMDGTALSLDTWLSAQDNVLVTSVTSHGSAPVELEASTWAGAVIANSAYSNSAGSSGGVAWAQRSTAPGSNWVSTAALATRVLGADSVQSPTVSGATARTVFTLKPGRTALIVTAVAGGGQNPADPQQAAAALVSAQDARSLARMEAAHVQWWKAYWTQSSIDIGNTVLERYYYAAQYFIGSASRPGKVAPALYGIWVTTDSPQFSGDYHMNYNAMGPFYGVYSSNRPELALPFYEVILDYVPEARRRAKQDLTRVKPDYVGTRFPAGGVPDGVLFPVGIGPFGSTTDDEYLQQVANSLFAASQFAAYYEYTQDRAFLRDKAYPFLALVATFFQYYLEWDQGTGQYVLWSGPQENAWGQDSSSDLGLLKQVLTTLIGGSRDLGIDAGRRSGWQHLLDHLPPQPTAVYQGTTVFSLVKAGTMQGSDTRDIHPGDNTVNLEFIHPAGVLGIDSDPAQLSTARDTLDVMDSWDQVNSFPKVFTQAARVGYPAQQLIDRFTRTITQNTVANLRIADPYHGIEKSGAVEAINDMLVQSDRGVIVLFPVWPSDQDASFHQLRQQGAFVVSSELRNGTVGYADVTSDAGNTLRIRNPWPGRSVTVTDHRGRAVRTSTDDGVITVRTERGGSYRLTRSGPTRGR